MLQIIVSGKPSNFHKVERKEGSTTGAVFILTEKRFIQKALYNIAWTVCVPHWKVEWVEKCVEKGYTVAVTASDFSPALNKENPNGAPTLYLMLDECHMI